MQLPVTVEVKEGYVREAAEGAPEGPFPGVHPQVAVEASLVREDGRTLRAREGLYARVDAPVDAQVAACREALTAKFARVGA